MIKKYGNLTVNDGGGLMDNEGMCDSLIQDCNSLVKMLASGYYLGFCGKVVEMTQKLSNLKDGIKQDMESKDKTIEELKRVNDSLVEEKTGIPVEKDGGNE